MVWVKFKEKWRGKNMGVHWKQFRSERKARETAREWNQLTPRDKVTVTRVRKTRPVGLIKKRKVKGIYLERKR